jgi:ribosome assembly protein YihI (activator of Der GTPase)
MEGDSVGGQRPKKIAYVELWATRDTNTNLKSRCDDKAMKSKGKSPGSRAGLGLSKSWAEPKALQSLM